MSDGKYSCEADKVEAVCRVMDFGHPAAAVANELGLNEFLLRRWVADERVARSRRSTP